MRRKEDRRHFTIVGYTTTGETNHVIDKEKQIELNEDIVKYAHSHKIEEIVIANNDIEAEIYDQLIACKLSGIDVKTIAEFIEQEVGQIPTDMLNELGLLNAVKTLKPRWGYEIFTSMYNRVLAGFVLVVTLPIMLLAIIAIKVEDGRRADVFYWQERVGIKGRRFRIYKFRSMRSDAEKDGARMAIANDFRVTAVGKILRKYRIDELPQLLNVFKGEMRFVGPRPERPVFVKDLINKYQYFNERHNVMPGLTGWAQIKYPYGSNLRDSFEKLKFDMYYIKHQSILFDVEILCRTVDLVLFGRGQ